MYSKIYSAALAGMDSFLVCVETDVSDGLPHMEMVGVLALEAREAKERVRTALKNTGVRLPPKRITINLSPADRRKEGTGFDLSIAAGVLVALQWVPIRWLEEAVVVGEVCLDGSVRGIRGILSMAVCAKNQGKRRIFLPWENRMEGASIEGLDVIPVKSIGHLISLLKEEDMGQHRYLPSQELQEETGTSMLDFNQIGGQAVLKRAAEVACAGMHNFLMIGAAGTGKSMVAKRIPTILPKLTKQEQIQISSIYSVAGYLPEGQGLMRDRPFRSPHHTITAAGLAGGGRIPAPGEISLAHGGVLFLDELAEFRENVLETLRQPMEDHRLTLVRAGISYSFPADFMLVAAMNPCRCGYYPDRQYCHCTEKEVQTYLGRISRPLLDRMDICAEVSKAAYDQLEGGGESSEVIRHRIERVAELQRDRYGGTSIGFNGRIPSSQLNRYCPMDTRAEALYQKVYEKMTVSTRGLHSLRRIARTIADLEQKEVIGYEHISEAVFYRVTREQYWNRHI